MPVPVLPSFKVPRDKGKAVKDIYGDSVKDALRQLHHTPSSGKKSKRRQKRPPLLAAEQIVKIYELENNGTVEGMPRVQTARPAARGIESSHSPKPPQTARPSTDGGGSQEDVRIKRIKPRRTENGLIIPRPKIPGVLGPRAEPAAQQFKNDYHHPRVSTAANAYMYSSPSPRRRDGTYLSQKISTEEMIQRVFGDDSDVMREYVEKFATQEGEEAPPALRNLYEGLRKRDPRLAYEWDQSWVTKGDHPFVRGYYRKAMPTVPNYHDKVAKWEAPNMETLQPGAEEEGIGSDIETDANDCTPDDGPVGERLPQIADASKKHTLGDSSFVRFEGEGLGQILAERSKLKRLDMWAQLDTWKKSSEGKQFYRYKGTDALNDNMEKLAEEGRKLLEGKRQRDAWDRPWRSSGRPKSSGSASPKKSRKKSVPDISDLVPGAKKEYGRARPPSPMSEDPRFLALLKRMEEGGPEFEDFVFRLSKLNSTDFRALSDALSRGNSCKRVVLTGAFQNESKLSGCLSRLIKRLSSLEEAYLNTVDVSSETATHVFNAISGSGGDGASSRLHSLYLDKNRIRKLDGFGNLLRSNRSLFLKVVSMCKNRISNDGAFQLASGLSSNHVLEELYLTENLIGDPGFKDIGKALSSNSALRILAMEENPVTPNGLEWFFRGFVSINRTLVDFRVGNVAFEEASTLPAPPPAELKKRRSTLLRVRSSSKVDMQLLQGMESLFEDSSSDIHEIGSTSKRKEKQLNGALTLLEEKWKEKSQKRSFMSVIHSCVFSASKVQCLSRLSIAGDWAEAETSMDSLCHGVRVARQLRVLDLSGNRLKRKTLSNLCSALNENVTVSVLVLAGCRIGNDGAAVLSSFLRQRSAKLSKTLQFGTAPDDLVKSELEKSEIEECKQACEELHYFLSDSNLSSYFDTMARPLLSRDLSAGPVFVRSIDVDASASTFGATTLCYSVHTPGLAFLDVSDCGISDAGMIALFEATKWRQHQTVRVMPSWCASPFSAVFGGNGRSDSPSATMSPPKAEGDIVRKTSFALGQESEGSRDLSHSSLVLSCQGIRQMKKVAKLMQSEIEGKLRRLSTTPQQRSDKGEANVSPLTRQQTSRGRSLLSEGEALFLDVEVLSSIKVLRALDNEFSRECLDALTDSTAENNAPGLHEVTLSTCTSNMSLVLPFPRLLQSIPLSGHLRSIQLPSFLESTMADELKKVLPEEEVKGDNSTEDSLMDQTNRTHVNQGREHSNHKVEYRSREGSTTPDACRHAERDAEARRDSEGSMKARIEQWMACEDRKDEGEGKNPRSTAKARKKPSKKGEGKQRQKPPTAVCDLSTLTKVKRLKETELAPPFLPGGIGGLRVATVEIPTRELGQLCCITDQMRLAFLMGTHGRLGEDSLVQCLPPAIIAFILAHLPSFHFDLLQR